jgi:hypothetical protein
MHAGAAAAGKSAGDRRRREPLAASGSFGGSGVTAAVPPKWFVTADELNRAPAYMRGRVTLDKVGPCAQWQQRGLRVAHPPRLAAAGWQLPPPFCLLQAA